MRPAATAAGLLAAAALLAPAAAQAAPELSTSTLLDQRRYTAIGTRAYVMGSEEGRFPAMGFHTRGEMGGVFAPPIKLLDGFWFGIDDAWLPPATRFTSGYGYVRMDVPGRPGLSVTRTEFAPDGALGVLSGLTFRSTGAAQRFTLKVDAHSELMKMYPWGETTPSQTTFNLADAVAFRDDTLVFTERGTPPPPSDGRHDWAAAVGTRLETSGHATGENFRGPQDPPVICPASGPNAPPQPPRCDDTAYGKGKGGQLRYEIRVPAGGERTVWLGVAGSTDGENDARRELRRLLADPDRALRRKVAERERLAGFTRLTLPGDPLLAEGIDWSKQNLADSVQEAEDLEIRETNAGKRYPEPEGRLRRATWLGAGWPDYPWLFGTDGEYTAFASVAAGQFEPIADHLRALRDVSLIDNGRSGKVVHEVVHDGTVFFGSNADPGNTDETAKFPSAVALIWRWTGDERFLREMYDFSRANMRYIFRELDDDRDGWPEGLGNVEREGMGEEKLDNTVYTIRGLYDLADMADARRDRATRRWALEKARDLSRRFEAAWWMDEVPRHADSLENPGNVKKQQRHWIGVTPMEAELTLGGRPAPGLTTFERAVRALDLTERPCYSDDNGMYHTGEAGCDPAVSDRPSEKDIFTLNTAIVAVGEGNYGRMGPGQQQRFTTDNRQPAAPEANEQPGAMPERAPAPAYGDNKTRHFNERGMVLQAWGAYGTVWPVVHQQLGVRPDLGRRRLEVIPQVPDGQPSVAGEAIRLGRGELATRAARSGPRHTTEVDTGRVPIRRLLIGHTLRRGSQVARVTLDGRPVRRYRVERTNRGEEVTVRTRPGRHVLEVTAAG